MSWNKIVNVNLAEQHLAYLKQGADDLGLEFLEGQTTYQTHEGNRACIHAIRMAGQRHEIGVVKTGDLYSLACDFYACQRLRDTVGDKFEQLMQRMSTNIAKTELYGNGAREVREERVVVDNVNRVRLVATY